MRSPTRGGGQLSGDFETLLSNSADQPRPPPVSLRGLNLRSSSSLKAQASSQSLQPFSSTPLAALPASDEGAQEQYQDQPLIARGHIEAPVTNSDSDGRDADPQQAVNASSPFDYSPAEDSDSPQAPSEDSFATAHELMSQRSGASTLWEEAMDNKHSALGRKLPSYAGSQQAHSPTVSPSDKEQVAAPTRPAATSYSTHHQSQLSESLAAEQPRPGSSILASRNEQPVQAAPPSLDGVKGGAHQHEGSNISEQQTNPSAQTIPGASEGVDQDQAGEDAHAAPHVAYHMDKSVSVQAQAPVTVASDENQERSNTVPAQAETHPHEAGSAASSHSAPASSALQSENATTSEPADVTQSPNASSRSSGAPKSSAVSPDHLPPRSPAHAPSITKQTERTGQAAAYDDQAALSSSHPEQPSVPVLERHQAHATPEAAAGPSVLLQSQQQICHPSQLQHSRSSSEVAGPGDEEYSTVDTSELESFAGSEGQSAEQEAGARDRSTEAGAIGRAAGEAAADIGRNEESELWRRQRKHVFVLSNAGKPIFTLHGDENALAGLMAVIQALISFMKDQSDELQSVKAGKHNFVFLQHGPVYLVAVAATAEPVSALRLQLHLLHAQIVCILTDGFHRMFSRNPRFDSRRLLGGAEGVLHTLLQSFDVDPAPFLTAFAPLRMPGLLRRSLLIALQNAVKAAGALYGVLLAGSKVAALTQPRGQNLHPHDLLALSAFVRGSPSLQAAETFSPICLPHFNAAAFPARIRSLSPDAGVCLVLLSAQPDSFMRLADAARHFRAEVNDSGALQAAAQSANQLDEGSVSISALPSLAGGGEPGLTPLLHFVYKHPGRSQYVMASWDALASRGRLPQDVIPLYSQVHAAVFRANEAPMDPPSPPLRVYFHSTDEFSALAYASAEYEMYALFDAVAQKSVIVSICQRLCAWVKAQQAELFVPV